MKSVRRKGLSRTAPSRELGTLRARLDEAEETLRAIRSGEVDAVVAMGKTGPQVFTLEGADHAYRVLIESMNEGALTLMADKTILYSNPRFAQMVKCPIEQVTGSSFRRFLSVEDGAALRPLMKQADKSGSKIQVMLNAGDGSQMAAQISIRPLARTGDDHAIVGMVVTDMTEARRAASQQETAHLYAQACEHADELERRIDERTRQLLNANQELQAFESSVAHDLRGPLRHVMGFSQILLETYALELPEEARDLLNKIFESTQKMESMVAALLKFSRLSKQSLSLQPVDIGRMWHEVLAEMKPGMGDRHTKVTIGDLPPCRGDPVLLRQVLVNLLENALKYSRTRDCSIIEISAVAQPDGGCTTYSIKDNGVGFDMANAGGLFTVFTRLHNTNDFDGSGVGLSTVQRIIQRHGGRIWAEAAPGVGATFFFILDLSPSRSVHGAPSAAPPLRAGAI